MSEKSNPEPTKTQEQPWPKLSEEQRERLGKSLKKDLPHLKLEKPASQQETVH